MEIQIQDNIISVAGLGTLECYSNPFHAGNLYLRLKLAQYDLEVSKGLFDEIARQTCRPLQVMCESTETELTAFLERGGFERKRSCFECDITADALGGLQRPGVALHCAAKGNAVYDDCCKRLYHKYKEDHENVNPLTATFEVFARDLPEVVLHTENGCHFAFVEEDEIAYVGGEEEGFAEFAAALAFALLEEHESICFEADDCDRVGMILKNLLCPEEMDSFDTFVRPY